MPKPRMSMYEARQRRLDASFMRSEVKSILHWKAQAEKYPAHADTYRGYIEAGALRAEKWARQFCAG